MADTRERGLTLRKTSVVFVSCMNGRLAGDQSPTTAMGTSSAMCSRKTIDLVCASMVHSVRAQKVCAIQTPDSQWVPQGDWRRRHGWAGESVLGDVGEDERDKGYRRHRTGTRHTADEGHVLLIKTKWPGTPVRSQMRSYCPSRSPPRSPFSAATQFAEYIV